MTDYDCLEDAIYEEARTHRSYGCIDRMCGAQDCGTCFPSGQKWFECRFCGTQRQGWELSEENYPEEDSFTCDDCLIEHETELEDD